MSEEIKENKENKDYKENKEEEKDRTEENSGLSEEKTGIYGETAEIENENKDEEKNVISDETVTQEEAAEESASVANGDNGKDKKKKRKTISVKTFVISTIAIILATLMTTYGVCSAVFQKKYADNFASGGQNGNDINQSGGNVKTGLALLDEYINAYFYGDPDKDIMLSAAMKAYMYATGDVYADYYTLEELLADIKEREGNLCGIGINVTYTSTEYNGKTIPVIAVFNVMDNSPAMEAGVQKGDMITHVTTSEGEKSIEELTYEKAVNEFLGEEGTSITFTVLRKQGEGYESVPFTVVRKNIESESVVSSISESDKSVGILKILSFNYPTPKQLDREIEKLMEAGCDKFVLDLRNNPGGMLESIHGVLSYFLDEGTVYIRTKDSKGTVTEQKILPVTYSEKSGRAGSSVLKENIGKYKNLDMVVLCNKSTASAAELFTANFKDYGIGEVVGVNTYGKGKMQTTYNLNMGLSGAVKMTTHMYYSGGDEELVGYDGVGIEPDTVVELDDNAKKYNFYLIPEAADNQLQAAIKSLIGN